MSQRGRTHLRRTEKTPLRGPSRVKRQPPSWSSSHSTCSRQPAHRPQRIPSWTYNLQLRLSLSLATAASLLLGFSVVMTVFGIVQELHLILGLGLGTELGVEFSSGPVMVSALAAGAMLALSVGVRIPQKLAVWFCSCVWFRWIKREPVPELSTLLLGATPGDRHLHWVVMSSIAVIAGILCSLSPVILKLIISFKLWLDTCFVWSDVLLVGLGAFLAFLSGLWPLMSMGLAISCAHRLSCRFGAWEPAATGWLLIGAAIGAAASGWIAQAVIGGSIHFLGASLPVLLVSLLSVISGSGPWETDASFSLDDDASIPIHTDRHPGLLRMGVVTIGACTISLVVAWLSVYAMHGVTFGTGVAPMLLAVGGGFLAGCGGSDGSVKALRTFGLSCLVAAGISLLGSWGVWGGWLPWPTGTALTASAGLVSLGFSVAFGYGIVMRRVGRRASIASTLLGRMLVYGAIFGLMGSITFCRQFNPAGAVVVTGFVLIIMGAMLCLLSLSAARTRLTWSTITERLLRLLAIRSKWQASRDQA